MQRVPAPKASKSLERTAHRWRDYFQSMLGPIQLALGRYGISARFATAVNADGTVDGELFVEREKGADLLSLLITIETVIRAWKNPDVWITVGLEFDPTTAAAYGYVYPARDRGAWREWTYPVHLADMANAFLVVRQGVEGQESMMDAFGPFTSAVIVRFYWSPGGAQPGRPRHQ